VALADGVVDELSGALIPSSTKSRNDPSRWHEVYGDKPIKATAIDANLLRVADLAGRSRQAAATFLASHVDVRIAGLCLVRTKHGRWGAAEYAVIKTEEASDQSD
jgi:hypothetical protein